MPRLAVRVSKQGRLNMVQVNSTAAIADSGLAWRKAVFKAPFSNAKDFASTLGEKNQAAEMC